MSQISLFADSAYQNLNFYIFAIYLLDAMQPRSNINGGVPLLKGPSRNLALLPTVAVFCSCWFFSEKEVSLFF